MTKKEAIKIFEEKKVAYPLGRRNGRMVFLHSRCGECTDG